MKDTNLQKVHGRNQAARLNTVRHANVSACESIRGNMRIRVSESKTPHFINYIQFTDVEKPCAAWSLLPVTAEVTLWKQRKAKNE